MNVARQDEQEGVGSGTWSTVDEWMDFSTEGIKPGEEYVLQPPPRS